MVRQGDLAEELLLGTRVKHRRVIRISGDTIQGVRRTSIDI